MKQTMSVGVHPGDAPAQPTDRLFFAIYPDAETAARIGQLAKHLREDQQLRGKPLEVDRFHITLFHLGDHAGLPQGVVASAKQAAQTFTAARFDVEFDYAESFHGRPRNRPFVLRGDGGLAALMRFQQALGVALRHAGLGCWVGTPYVPHVTLLYDDRAVARCDVAPIRWTAQEFVLVHSLLGRHTHLSLAHWPLVG